MWDPSDLLSLWDFFCGILYGIPCGIHLGSMRLALVHVTRDTHGLVARGWLESLVFSLVFNLACSSTITSCLGVVPYQQRPY